MSVSMLACHQVVVALQPFAAQLLQVAAVFAPSQGVPAAEAFWHSQLPESSMYGLTRTW